MAFRETTHVDWRDHRVSPLGVQRASKTVFRGYGAASIRIGGGEGQSSIAPIRINRRRFARLRSAARCLDRQFRPSPVDLVVQWMEIIYLVLRRYFDY